MQEERGRRTGEAPEACAKLVTAISAQDCLEGRCGYRPGRGALDAVRDLTFALQYGR